MNNRFKFNDKIYEQKNGAPMGCNLSPIVAETLVSHIFKQAMSTFPNKPKFLKFYVDDSFLIINKQYADLFHAHINNIASKYGSIKFTIEKETENQLPFLDVLVKRDQLTIKTRVYRKATHSERYLNFYSHHSLNIKKSVIRSLSLRAISHTSDKNDLAIEFDHIRNVLTINDYPIKLIDSIIKYSLDNFDQPHAPNYDITRAINMPYYSGVSEEIHKIFKAHNINVAYSSGATLKSLLNDNNQDILSKNNVVYNLACSTCNAHYVGTTKRKLKDRINEHKGAIKTLKRSNVAAHIASNPNHQVDFSNPKISFRENKYKSWMFLESWQIEKCKMQKIDLMNDKQNSNTCIPRTYLTLLKQ